MQCDEKAAWQRHYRNSPSLGCLHALQGYWRSNGSSLGRTTTKPYELNDTLAAAVHYYLSPNERARYDRCRAVHDTSWQWGWKSDVERCAIQRPSGPQLSRALSGKRLLFWGDSLMKQQVRALLALRLADGTRSTHEVLPAGCNWTDTARLPVTCFRLTSRAMPSATVCYVASEFTVITRSSTSSPDGGPDDVNAPDACTTKVRVLPASQTPLTPGCLAEFDVVVMSDFAHWVGQDGAGAVASCLHARGASEAEAHRRAHSWVTSLYAKQLVLREQLLALSPIDSRSYYLLAGPAEPDHRTDALLPPDRPESPRFDRPALNLSWLAPYRQTAAKYGHNLFGEFNELARRALGCSESVMVSEEVASNAIRRSSC